MLSKATNVGGNPKGDTTTGGTQLPAFMQAWHKDLHKYNSKDGAAHIYYSGYRRGKSLVLDWANQGQLPSKRAKGVRDAPHIGITVNGDMLHLTAVNTQLGLHGLLPKMKVSLAPKWLTDKVAVLRIMEPYHDWVTGIGQRTGEDCFTVLCPYKYAPRKRRYPEVTR